jgi:phage gp36-like protein
MPYCTREDVENVYGVDNLLDWADVNGTGDAAAIANRISWSLDRATRRINARLQRRNFEIPFALPYPGIIIDTAADLAGYYLYFARMLDAEDRSKNNLSHMLKSAEQTLDEIVKGEIILSNTMQDHTDAPFVQK